MFKSRVVLAIIGVIVIGGTSAAVAWLSGINTGSLVNAPTATATATTTVSAPANASASFTPTTASSSDAPTRAPTRAPSGQIIDLHGTIEGVDIGSSQFTLKDTSGTSWTVQATANTTYEGASQTLRGLQAGMLAEVSGVLTGGTTFLAYHVHAETA